MKKTGRKTNLETFEISEEDPVYVIGVVSSLVKLPVWTLRILDKEGLVSPKRRFGKGRLYCLCDIKRLVQIRQLLIDERVNIKGVKMILRMRAESERNI